MTDSSSSEQVSVDSLPLVSAGRVIIAMEQVSENAVDCVPVEVVSVVGHTASRFKQSLVVKGTAVSLPSFISELDIDVSSSDDN
jgi:hypothetical protein